MPQGGYPGAPGYPAAPPRQALPGKRGRKWLPWVAAGVVVGIAAGGIAAGFLLTGGSSPAASGGSGDGVLLPKSLTFSGSPSPVTGRTSADGLSWDKLGGPWTPVPTSLFAQGDFAAGQQVISDKFTQNGKTADWTADVLAGRPGSDVGVSYTGPSQLRQYAVGVVDNVILAKEYPAGTSAPGIASQSVTIGGRPGWLIGFTPHFSVAGVKATHDTDVVVVVDTGHAAVPSVFFMSIPSDVSSLLPNITAELHSLQVSP
ncbi:MAG TPA: hypothetical protein VKS82_03135 [Streptosporangiaceae bacterium]|nr:hypothetical protein [Streptosporangiaceae bacterium]